MSELYHFNIPWLHAIVADSKQTALVMTYHSFRNESLNVHSALSKNKVELSRDQWISVLKGSTSALFYLTKKCIIHKPNTTATIAYV